MLLDGPPHAVNGLPAQPGAVVDRHVEVELLVQLVLPLDLHTLRCQDQNALCQTCKDRLSEDQPSGNRLPEADLIGDQQPAWPLADEARVCPHLVLPGRYRAGRLAHLQPVREARRLSDERPDNALEFIREQLPSLRLLDWRA